MSSHCKTASYRTSAVSAGRALSKAIRDGRYEDLKDLLSEVDTTTGDNCSTTIGDEECCNGAPNNPLWEANSRGWTPMHVAAITCTQMPIRWWKWILEQQQQHQCCTGKPSLLGSQHTDMGHSVLELFFRTSLFPLHWLKHSLRLKAIELHTAIEKLLEEEDPSAMEELRHCIRSESDVEHDKPVALVLEFWNKTQLLVHAAAAPPSTNDERPILSALAFLPWCPEIVARLAMALFPEQIFEQVLPLHTCVRSLSPVSGHLTTGMLPVLCRAYPAAARGRDPFSQDRFPLHTALTKGQSWEDCVRFVFDAHPFACHIEDPVTRFPAFVLPTLFSLREQTIETNAKQSDERYHSLCWPYLPQRDKQRALLEAKRKLECQQLTTVYQILKQHPSVLEEFTITNNTTANCNAKTKT